MVPCNTQRPMRRSNSESADSDCACSLLAVSRSTAQRPTVVRMRSSSRSSLRSARGRLCRLSATPFVATVYRPDPPAAQPQTSETNMPFLSIVKSAEDQGAPPAALLEAMDKFVAGSVNDRPVSQTGGLAPSAAGFRIRMSGGKLTITDGPFAEAKEVVGGYAVLAAKTRQEALDAAQRFMELHVKHWPTWVGECEVREVVFLAP